MRLVAYLRISSTTQLEGFGLDVQRKAVRQWSKAHGHRIIAEYVVDAGVSGATDAVDRPGLSDALEQIGRPPRAEGRIAARLDRVARALTVQEAILALCWREGARVFIADTGEVLRDDPDDPMRGAMRQMAGVFAELDRRTTVKRMRDGIRTKAETGRKATGSYPFGYTATGRGRERDAGPREDEQRTVGRIVELRRAGADLPGDCGQPGQRRLTSSPCCILVGRGAAEHRPAGAADLILGMAGSPPSAARRTTRHGWRSACDGGRGAVPQRTIRGDRLALACPTSSFGWTASSRWWLRPSE
ncbi:MAG: recombinase family protein [Actinobacteria bacterium]|nr:recombinase family protein [Actinomycetota bacterium]